MPTPRHRTSNLRFALSVFSISLVIGLTTPTEARAADASVVRVRMPIIGDVDQSVRRQITRVLGQRDAVANKGRPLLILEFAAEPEQDATGSEFERSMALARFLSGGDLARFRTVAWLPGPVSGHAVLPVLACEEIVMHPDASLGAAGKHESKLPGSIRAFYAEVADLRRTVPVPVAMGMLDRKEKLYKAETADGTRYISADDLDEFKKETNVQSVETLCEAGDLLTISGSDMRRKHGFASHLALDRRDLATKLSVPLSGLQPDSAAIGAIVGDSEWRSVRVDLIGPLSANSVKRLMRMIDDQLLAEKNLICLWIDSPGGDLEQSIRLAGQLSRLDPTKVRTVAYVEKQTLGDAAIVAIACDDLVMGIDAKLGGPGAVNPSDEVVESIRPPLEEICKDQSARWSVPLALVDDEQVVYAYTLKGAPVKEYLNPEELVTLPQPDRWERGEAITKAGEPLQLDSNHAVEVGLARHIVKDYAEFKRIYELESDPTLVEPSWANELIDDLAQPHIATTLIFFAFFALMVELSSPGLGAGGFISTLCFVLYFWSQYLHGTAGMLEVLLFMVGLVFIGVEVFVLPGMGLFGLGGGALMIASLVLASQTFVVPQNAYQMEQLPRSLMTVIGGLCGLVVGLIVLRKFLNRAPGLKRVMLNPPEGEQRKERARREAIVDYEHLLHQTGTATTRLIPSGKAKFGSDLIDVVTEGQAVDKGAAIEVVEVQGNRIVVRPARGSGEKS